LPQYTTVSEEEPASDATLGSSEEQDAEDFEEATPRPPYAERPVPLHERLQQQSESMTIPPSMMRSGSMATVRIQRRVRLAEKLKQVFDLDGIEEVWAGMSPLFMLRHIFTLAQKCLVGFCAPSVSILSPDASPAKYTLSAPRVYVSNKLVPLFLRAYAR
jgi:hypothetical protein